MAPESSTDEFRRAIRRGSQQLFNPRILVKRGKRLMASSAFIAIVDQALVSGVNFATALVLARFLSPTGYGYYVLLFALLLFCNSIQSALITSPLMVLSPRHTNQTYSTYINSLLAIQLIGCCIATLALIGIMQVGHGWWPAIAPDVSTLPVVVAIISYMAQEFARRAMFARQDQVGAFIIDVVSYGSQFTIILVLIFQQLINLELVLWVMGLTSLLSSVVGFMRLRLSLQGLTLTDIKAVWREHWEQGRWLSGSTLAQWGGGQLYPFVVAAVLSPAATGILAASQNLLGVTHIFLLGVENFVPTTATRHLLRGGADALVRWIRLFRIFSATAIGIYCILVALFAQPLVHLVFGAEYADASQTVAIMALAYFIISLVRAPMVGLRALKKPVWIFMGYGLSALITMVIAVPLVMFGGLAGAASGFALHNFMVLLVTSVGYRRAVRTYKERAKEVEQVTHEPAHITV